MKLNSLPYDRSKEPWKWFYVDGFLVLTKKTQKTIENDLKIYIIFFFFFKKKSRKKQEKILRDMNVFKKIIIKGIFNTFAFEIMNNKTYYHKRFIEWTLLAFEMKYK